MSPRSASLMAVLASCARILVPAAAEPASLWDRDNLVAWEVTPFDSVNRSPDERAQMLRRVGFKQYAYLSVPQRDEQKLEEYPQEVDAEIEVLKKHGVNLLAWFYWADDPARDPEVRMTLEAFKRHDVRPQLWISQSYSYYPKTPEQWAKYYPEGFVLPTRAGDFAKLSQREREAIKKAQRLAWLRVHLEDFPKTPKEQMQRVRREADRIRAFAELAAFYGCRVSLYNHNGWFGMLENQLAIIEHLGEGVGTTNVGIVYNFSHARDEMHDDSKNFRELWERVKPHVVAVNITAMKFDDGEVYYPSQGDAELEMIRIIQESGWKGPIGLLVQRPGDAEITLQNNLIGLNWLAAELRRPGSGGPRPFPLIAQ